GKDQRKPLRASAMPLRHTVYCKRSVAAVTPEKLLTHLKIPDYWTLGEDYDISEKAVDAALPLRIENMDPGRFRLYHLSYGEPDRRRIKIERWRRRTDIVAPSTRRSKI